MLQKPTRNLPQPPSAAASMLQTTSTLQRSATAPNVRKGSDATKMDAVRVPDDTPKAGNCGVTACAVMAGVSFHVAWDAFYLFTPKGSTWKGRAAWSEQMRVLRHFDVRVEEVTIPYPQMTIRSFAERYASPDEMYLIGTGTHAQVLYQNRIFDQNTSRDGATPDEYWGKAKYVQHIWRRLRSDEEALESSIDDREVNAAFKVIEAVYRTKLSDKKREGWLIEAKSLEARPRRRKALSDKLEKKYGVAVASKFILALHALARA